MPKDKLTNNQKILQNAKAWLEYANSTRFSKLIDKCQIHVEEYIRWIVILIKKRLEVGAITYGEEVPISDEDLLLWAKSHGKSRDNIDEAMEEEADAIVYLGAEYIKPLSKYEDSRINTLGNEYKQEIQRALVHLSYSMIYLLIAKDKRATYVNEMKKRRL
tara:strand:- start:355 stop:837 length:483 start_codon:yes stop_codon:yes gene_type:complete